jgi:hypothetical protein
LGTRLAAACGWINVVILLELGRGAEGLPSLKGILTKRFPLFFTLDVLRDPILSIVATLRKADKRSDASVPKARQAPLKSSIRAIRLRDLCRDL